MGVTENWARVSTSDNHKKEKPKGRPVLSTRESQRIPESVVAVQIFMGEGRDRREWSRLVTTKVLRNTSEMWDYVVPLLGPSQTPSPHGSGTSRVWGERHRNGSSRFDTPLHCVRKQGESFSRNLQSWHTVISPLSFPVVPSWTPHDIHPGHFLPSYERLLHSIITDTDPRSRCTPKRYLMT